jgi:hypothetical protein
VKEELLADQAISIGTGRGGSVGLANERHTSEGLNVFVSYSHLDEAYKTDLLKHLEPLRKMGLIRTWFDGEIKAGDEWEKSI